MSKIKIKYFGPIKEGYQEKDGWMDVKKVTVLIGNQGSGKSTVAKLISTMTWIEKALNRGDLLKNTFTTTMFLNFLRYQRINNYFNKEKTLIEYEGDSFYISYDFKNQFPVVRRMDSNSYIVPKIMYVPAERNFLGSVSDAFNVKGLPPSLFTFAEELKQAQRNIKGNLINLPINNYQYEYDQEKDISTILGKDFKVNLLEASSGLQSTIPLFLVTRYLSLELKDDKETDKLINVNNIIRRNNEIAKVMMNLTLLPKQKEDQVKLINKKYINKCLINIVEEPEQNLYPSSQRSMLNNLLEYNNMFEGSKLIMTTHSPYLIIYLTHAVKAHTVLEKLKSYNENNKLIEKLNQIVPIASVVHNDNWIVYELDDNNGSIKKLENYNGLPSDNNYLNESLGTSNDIYINLLEIEDSCQ